MAVSEVVKTMREDHPAVSGETRASSKSSAFSSIQGRLVGLLLLVLVPILVAHAYFSYDRYQSSKRVESTANLGLARATAKAFDTFIQDVLHQELAIGLAFTSSQPLSEKEQSRILLANQAANQAIWHFLWNSPAGIVTAATRSQFIGMDVSDREYYREIIAGKEWVVSDLLLSKATRQPSFTISRGIRNERGELLGIIVAAILPAKLDRVLAVERPGDAGVSLLDSKGMHVYRYPAAQYTWEQRNWLKLYPFLEQVANGKEIVNAGHESKIRKGTKRIVAFTPVPSIAWIASCSRAEKETVGPIISATLQETGLILLVALVSLIIAFALSRTISSSVKILRNHALSIGRGEKENPLTLSRPTEIKELGETFNKMAAEMRLREKALRESEERFRSVVENMSEGLMLFDEQGMIYQNPASLRIHGFRGSPEMRIEHNDLSATWKGWDETGRTLSFEEWPLYRVLRRESFQGQVLRAVGVETGRKFWASYNGFPILGVDGKLALGFITIRDITETKRAEEALRESEAKLSAVIKQLPIGVALINNEGQSILSNTSYQRYEPRCVPSKDPERKNRWKAYSPDGRLLPQDQWAAARALGGEYVSPGLECQYTDDAGHETWVQVSAVPFRVERDETARAIVTIEDISERKQAEASLRESEERFRIMADGLPLLVWVHDAEGRQQLVNQTLCEYFGVTREQMKEGRWQVLMHPDDAEAYASDFMACVRDHRNFNAQTRVKRADGQWRWIESWGRPRMDSTGRYLGYVGTSADITDRKQAEEALRETEERFRLALRNAPVSVAAQDRDLKYIWAYNQKTAPPEAIIGKSDYEIFTPEEAAHITAMKRRVLEEDIILKERMWFNRPSGPIFLEVCWEPLHDETGRVTGVASATVDMTSLKQTEEEFKNLNEKLESLVQERTIIAQDRAKQLQALAVELTEAEEQERRRIAQLLHDDLQQILAASRMQLETACMDLPHVPLIESVRQLLQESVLKTRHLSHELSPAVLHQAGIVTALQWLASKVHEQFGLHVHFQSDGEAQIPKSKFDSFIFRSVQELLFNINKHANTQDAIVRFSITNGSYVVTVLDKGKGFDTSLLNSFDPKAGFGLLTIKERANYIGGNLLIESELGQGSRFTLTVPIIKHKPNDFASSYASINSFNASSDDKTGLRVLFVDDHKVIRNGLIKLIAGQPDIQVIGEASNGAEAIDAARQQRPDVIVMDISMPELDGIEATKIIKSEMPAIRVIGLTMHDDEHIIEQMLSAGAEATLNKSASTSQLLKTIYGRKDLRN
jgi:PAS domain S-box-containing protein